MFIFPIDKKPKESKLEYIGAMVLVPFASVLVLLAGIAFLLDGLIVRLSIRGDS